MRLPYKKQVNENGHTVCKRMLPFKATLIEIAENMETVENIGTAENIKTVENIDMAK